MTPTALGYAAWQAGPLYSEPEGWGHTVYELLGYLAHEQMDNVPGTGSVESWGEEGRAQITPCKASPPIPQDLQSVSCYNKHFSQGECIPSSPSTKDTLLLGTESILHFNSSIPASSLSICLSKGSMGIPRVPFLPPCPPLQGGKGGKTHPLQSTGSL